jgi:probable F420-dependent oxidoreductase
VRFWLGLTGVVEYEQLPKLAAHAEACGFHGVHFADHLVMPARIESAYPYSPDGKFLWPTDAPWPDTWITLAMIGAATSRIQLATNVYLAGLRDPFTVARTIATVSVFTGGRVVLGTAAGWIREEFEAVGIDFASRGRRLDEVLRVVRKLWTGEPVSHDGEFFRFDAAIVQPRPVVPVPIWTGGTAKPALRRAAANDGWLGVPLMLDGNVEIVGRIKALRHEMGLPEAGFSPCIALTQRLDADVVATLHDAGIRDMSAMPWMSRPWDIRPYVDAGADIRSFEVRATAISRYAETVIANYGD